MAVLRIQDDSFDEWEASIEAHPVLGDELRKMQEVYVRLHSGEFDYLQPDQRFGRIYQQVYGSSDYSLPIIDRMFRRCAARVKSEDQEMVEKFADPRVERLKSESRVVNTFSPIALCLKAEFGKGSDVLSEQMRVEAIPRFIMSRLLFAIDQFESEIDVGEQVEALLDITFRRLFVPGKSSLIYVRAWVDPSDGRYLTRDVEYRLGTPFEVEEREGLIPMVYDTGCRFLEGPGRRLIPVIVDDNVKDDFSSALKVIRKGIALHQQLDKRRYTLYVFTREDLAYLRKRFDAAMNEPPFCVANVTNNIEGKGKVDHGNPHSDEHFRAVRHELRYQPNPAFERTVPVEANLQLAQHFADTKYSRTGARHKLYRLDQLCADYFPLRFPRFLFGVDFRKGSHDYEELRAKLI